MEDRRLDRLGDVRRIGRRARELRAGGEADLVVDDEVDRAAGLVAGQAGEAEAFGDDPLAGEGGVAVQQQRQDRIALASPLQVCEARALPSTTGSTASRCDGLGNSDRWTLLPSNSRSDEVPRWYLTSPEPPTSAGLVAPPANSWKIGAVGLAHHVGENVEPSAMGHADVDLLDAHLRRHI